MIATLKNILDVEDVFIIPKAPFVITGHGDGMLRFLNEDDLLAAIIRMRV